MFSKKKVNIFFSLLAFNYLFSVKAFVQSLISGTLRDTYTVSTGESVAYMLVFMVAL